MLYNLFKYLDKILEWPGAGLFQYVTFRAGAAIVLSLLISMLFGGKIINYLRSLTIGETIRDLGLKGQKEKEGTPTMGGIIIIVSILIPCLLLARLDNIYILLLILATTWMGAIGFADDYIKVFKKDKKGLKGRFKILGQIGFGLIIGLTMLFSDDIRVRMDIEYADSKGYAYSKDDIYFSEKDNKEYVQIKEHVTNVPFLSENELHYKDFLFFLPDHLADRLVDFLFVLAVIFIVTAVSNAANLTDGIDGLATGVSAIVMATLGILAYLCSNRITADYLNILMIPGAEEMVIFAACFLGACIGFLWYNAFPAQVFMGDTGSLTLGGIIAAMAILLKKELLIPLLCGIFLIEELSVMIQVSYFKYTKRKYGEGRRVFLMSPLHHHYQKKGIHESKIVTRFWIVGLLLAVLTIITLKIR